MFLPVVVNAGHSFSGNFMQVSHFSLRLCVVGSTDIYICPKAVPYGWDDPPLSILHKDIVAANLHEMKWNEMKFIYSHISTEVQVTLQ